MISIMLWDNREDNLSEKNKSGGRRWDYNKNGLWFRSESLNFVETCF